MSETKSVSPLNFHHVCRKITSDMEGVIHIPESEQAYSNRFEIFESAEGCKLSAPSMIRTLRQASGIPLTIKDNKYYLIAENQAIYVDGMGPVNGFSVLRHTSEDTEGGLIIPESVQGMTTFEAFVVETSWSDIKVGSRVWINKYAPEFAKFPINVGGVDCFLFPNQEILATE